MSDLDRQKWNAKYALDDVPREPSAVLTSLASWLPSQGRIFEIAGGAGRHSIWLAQRGLDVTLADISNRGLALARERALAAGVKLEFLETDLETCSLPTGPWAAIVSVCFLQRSLFPTLERSLIVGGRLLVVQPTRRNLEKHSKPPADFLLEEGELPRLVPNLRVLHFEEGWLFDDRHDAALVAERTK